MEHPRSLFFSQALLPQGWANDVRMEFGRGSIASLATDTPAEPGDERHALALPGMSNLHSHAFQRGMAGLAETRGPKSDNFWTWREQMYRFALTMTPDDVEAVASQLYVEMLEAGFTRVGEFHYLHNNHDGGRYADPAQMAQSIASAADHAQISLTLLPVFYAHANFGGLPPLAHQRRFVSSLEEFARLFEASKKIVAALDGGTIGLAPHSLRAVTPEELSAVISLDAACPIHLHVAEQTKEVDDCLDWSGQRPVAWLLEQAQVDGRWCFIHATHMTPDEAAAMARAHVTAGLCPITEANLGDGIFMAPEFLSAGGQFGIGSDSNILVGLADELRQFEYAQRLGNMKRNVVPQAQGQSTGRMLFDGALQGGNRSLGLARAGLIVGAPADIVTLDLDQPAFVGRKGDEILDAFIFASARGAIKDVWSRGRKVVTNGRHVKREAIFARFRLAMERLLS